MQLNHHDRDGLTVLSIQGELTAEETDRFRRAAIERMEADVRDFVLDLSRTDFIDSKGFETVLWLQEECVDRLGQVRLAAPQPHVLEAIHVTRLASRLEIASDVDAAIGSLRT